MTRARLGRETPELLVVPQNRDRKQSRQNLQLWFFPLLARVACRGWRVHGVPAGRCRVLQDLWALEQNEIASRLLES